MEQVLAPKFDFTPKNAGPESARVSRADARKAVSVTVYNDGFGLVLSHRAANGVSSVLMWFNSNRMSACSSDAVPLVDARCIRAASAQMRSV